MKKNRTKEQRKRDYINGDNLIKEAKNVPCADCKIKYFWYIMEFDHVRGIKLFNIGATRLRGLNKMKEEIAKCEIVCANCHRLRTYNRKIALLTQ